MRLLLDESVLIDFVGERREACACRDKLNALQITGCAELWTTVTAVDRLLAMLDADIPPAVARRAVSALLGFVNVCSVDHRDVLSLLGRDERFEVAMLLECFAKVKAERLITRREEVIRRARGTAVTPDGFFAYLEKERGLVFDLVDLEAPDGA